MGRVFIPLFLVATLAAGASPEYLSARRKFDQIQRLQAPPGSRIVITTQELNAYVRGEAPKIASDGIRNPRLELGSGRATGYALIDFPKLRQAQGKPMGWFMSRLLAGERAVQVDAKVTSGGGTATVDVERVTVSGIPISGSALDYLIRNYLWAYYPEAKVGKPFDLAQGVDRLEVQPSAVNVVMAAQPAKWRKVAQSAGR